MIMNSENLLGLYIYISGIFILMFQWKHILNMLLSFEILMLGIFFSFLLIWGVNSNEYSIMMIVAVFGVCEASLGLSLLVSLIRSHGNDYVNSLLLYKL
uniref:NADH-ubiquinone oxidoreductase chain 4L n=1 Tax=Sepia latimanus TaxID=3248881 RepID=T2HPM3_SEPLA|nr:NADH dehydrogenase subunit 4L [Sepia latimanus]QIC20345.1 NADH dehydrogenase subunit 4L [Sepia latimanus]BAN81955.1 NADH dehydrogenase subunit 4L [Sepia latimanus]